MMSTVLIITAFFINIAHAVEDPAFQLKRGVGACANLPSEKENFKCESIGWPDQNARIDLVKQEFVDKNGKQVRWGQFDYYYFFNGIKKCEPHKKTIIGHLKERKDLQDLFDKLGNDRDCIRQGRGWIQTRNIEVWKGKSQPSSAPKPQVEEEIDPMPTPPPAPAPVPEKDLDETHGSEPAPKSKSPVTNVDSKIKKDTANISWEGKKETTVADGMVVDMKPAPKAQKAVVIDSRDEEREPQSIPIVPSERRPKEFF